MQKRQLLKNPQGREYSACPLKNTEHVTCDSSEEKEGSLLKNSKKWMEMMGAAS